MKVAAAVAPVWPNGPYSAPGGTITICGICGGGGPHAGGGAANGEGAGGGAGTSMVKDRPQKVQGMVVCPGACCTGAPQLGHESVAMA